MEEEGCPLPDDRRYEPDRLELWFQPLGADRWRGGVTAHHAAFLGPLRSVTPKPVGSALRAGQSLALLESSRATAPLPVPFPLAVTEVNPLLAERPRIVNDDPYGDGWVAVVRAEAPEDPGRLATAERVRDLVRERIRAAGIRCWPRTPEATLVEVGIECSAVLAKLDEELAGRPDGAAVLLVTDDPTAGIELVRWTDRTGHRLLAHRSRGSLSEFLVQKRAAEGSAARPA